MFNKIPENQKVVMIFGTFDGLHAGHEYLIKHAKALGTYLIAVIARDKTVRQIKAHDPVNPERKRLQILQKTGLVDKVILGNLDDKYKVIAKYRPDVIALGYDQMVFTQKLNKILIDLNLNTAIERLDAFFPQVYKSSLLNTQCPNQNTASRSATTVETSLSQSIAA